MVDGKKPTDDVKHRDVGGETPNVEAVEDTPNFDEVYEALSGATKSPAGSTKKSYQLEAIAAAQSLNEPAAVITNPPFIRETASKDESVSGALPISPALAKQLSETLAGLQKKLTETGANSVDIESALSQNPELKRQLVEVMRQVRKEQSETWKEIRELINAQGRDPKEALVAAMKQSRVLGIGEQHTVRTYNPHRELGAEIMKDLHDKGGATHLAIELPQVLQPVFDAFHQDPGKGPLKVPTKLMKADGTEDRSLQVIGGLKFLENVTQISPDLIKLWTAARDAGIKVVCADNNSQALMFSGKDSDPLVPALNAQRDQTMKEKVMGILDAPVKDGEPKPKVVAWFGGFHLADSHGTLQTKSAGELIKEELKKKNEVMTNFYSQVDCGEVSQGMGLHPLTKNLDRAVSIVTHDAGGKPNVLAPVNVLRDPMPGFPFTMDNYDGVLIYPKAEVQDELRSLLESMPFPAGDGSSPPAGPFERRVPARDDEYQNYVREQITRCQAELDQLDKQIVQPADRPKTYLTESASASEIAIVGDQKNVLGLKQEINQYGMVPEKMLEDVLKNNRVVGLSIDSLVYDSKEVLSAMQRAKDSGVTHLGVPISRDLLERSIKSGKVYRSQLPSEVPYDEMSICMQAALLKGIKLFATDGGDNRNSLSRFRETAAVLDVLKEKNTKVIFLSDQKHLANSEDAEGHESTAQLLRAMRDPANPSQPLKVLTIAALDSNDVLLPMSSAFHDLKHPVAIETKRTHFLQGQKAGGEWSYKSPQTLGTWDYVWLRPNKRKY